MFEDFFKSGNEKLKLRQYPEAIKVYDKAIELKPDYADAYNNRGLAKYNLGRYTEAIKDYDKAIEFKPKFATAYNNCGLAKYNLGQYQGAIRDYDKAIELKPDDAAAYYSRGAAKYNLGEYQKAIEDYDKAIELKPDYVDAYNNRGVTKNDLGQPTEAIKDYDKALGLEPKFAIAYNNRGFAKKKLGQSTEAIKDYDKAIEWNSKYALAYNNRGVAKNDLGQPTEAIKDYDKAIELKPKFATAYNNRGFAKKNLKQYPEAITDYDKAIELKPNYAEAYNNRGLAKYNLGYYSQVVRDYDKAIELKPNYAEAYNNRGFAKDNLGQPKAAIKDYDKAIELKPDYKLAVDNRDLAKNKLEQQKLKKILEARKNTGNYLNTIWGKKQTPDQQPSYEVESPRIGISQSIGAFYKRKDKPGSRWFGKIGYHSSLFKRGPNSSAFTFARRKSAFESIKEKIAADLYEHLSNAHYVVPKTRLAELPIENQFTRDHAFVPMLLEEINEGRSEKINEGVFVMSRYVENYKNFEKLEDCVLGDERLDFLKCLERGKLPEEAMVEGKKVPILGLMEILAAGRLLADTDVLGGSARNAGYLIERNDQGDPIAVRTVKIDPGCAFNKDLDNLFYASYLPASSDKNVFTQDKRHLQYGNQFNIILWQNLTENQQKQFITALESGLSALNNTQEIAAKFVTRKAFEKTPKERPLPSMQECLNELGPYLKLQEKVYSKELSALRYSDQRCVMQ